MNSDEAWNQIQQLIDGIYLSDLLIEDTKDVVNISVKDSRNTTREVLRVAAGKINNLWTFISEATEISAEFLRYLFAKLSALQDEKSKIASLAEILSAKINGLHLTVDIPNSLTEMLLEFVNTNDASNVSDALGKGNHPLSVVVQIPELDHKYVRADCLGLLQPNQLVPAADSQWYHKVNQFTIKLNFSETIFKGTVNDSQALVALAIVLSCYPEQWREEFFWDAWLVVTIQLCLFANLKSDKMTFPCLWMKHAFDAERLVSPENVRHLLFGEDPVSKAHTCDLNSLCKATGIPFHAIGDDDPSIKGMKLHYGLDCDGDNPMKYCHDGLLMVNLIRCIGEDDEPLSKNSCRGAWIAYTLKIIHHFSSKNKPVIMLTTASSVLPEIYVPAVCIGDVVRAPNPSMPEGTKHHHQQNIDRVRQHLRSYNRPNHKQKSHVHKSSTVCTIL